MHSNIRLQTRERLPEKRYSSLNWPSMPNTALQQKTEGIDNYVQPSK